MMHSAAGSPPESTKSPTEYSSVGLVSEVYQLPSGVTLEVQGPKREFMVPFVKEFIGPIDRAARRLTIRPPEGLIED